MVRGTLVWHRLTYLSFLSYPSGRRIRDVISGDAATYVIKVYNGRQKGPSLEVEAAT